MKFVSLAAIAAFATVAVGQPIELSRRMVNVTKLNDMIPPTSSGNVAVTYGNPYAVYQPKAFIVSMFSLEREPWLEALDFAHNISIPGLSPLYQEVYCTTNYSICHVTTGEGEINAAATLSALTLSPLFDLKKTYWLIAGIAGGEPNHTTLGSVTFSKYAIQVGLEYQIAYQDYHNTNPNWTTGYFAYGTDNPWTYPQSVYGTEVFELNEVLRDRAAQLASNVSLSNGNEENASFRRLYTEDKARSLPSVEKCDTMTSDNYFSGFTLNQYFSDFATLLTNGSSTYCASAQEDNASLEVFLRQQLHGLIDYDRIVVMRTISDFVRPPPSLANNTVKFFTDTDFGGSEASIDNLVRGGLPFIQDVITNWNKTYANGTYSSRNYVGDILNSFGGTPDFGLESFTEA